ncbi:MAG: hypothetical protein FJ206_16820 [Gemmatimonadetes bacterium]|nr:hypothetical protein [Gemmatimonadota bacterium]
MRRVHSLLLVATLAAPAALTGQPDSLTGFDGWSLKHPRVQHYLDLFQGSGRDRMQRWLDRGASYRGAIRTELDRLGLPEEFEFLPMIESGYSATARSRAGAVGLWQFMPETARDYGLRVDRRIDERRHPWRATSAATRHLSDLTRTLGSPSLVAAAYNSGYGTIRSALARAGDDPAAPGADRFARLASGGFLPDETRNYLPQLVAAATIGKDPTRFGFAVPAPAIGVPPLPELASLPGLERPRRLPALGPLVRVGRGDDVATIAARHGVDPEELRRVNALPRWYPVRPGQALRLPAR